MKDPQGLGQRGRIILFQTTGQAPPGQSVIETGQPVRELGDMDSWVVSMAGACSSISETVKIKTGAC